MPAAQRYIRWDSGPWDGGLDNTSDPLAIQRGFLAGARNMDFDTAGLASKRNGRTKWNTLAITGSPTVELIGEYVPSASSTISLRVLAGNKLWKGDANAFASMMGAHADFSGIPGPDFVQVRATAGASSGKDIFIGCTGHASDKVFYSEDGGNIIDHPSANVPIGVTSVCVAGQRVLYAKGMLISFADPGDPLTVLAASSLAVNSPDGQNIVGIRPSDTNVMVLKSRSAWYYPISGMSDVATLVVRQIPGDAGLMGVNAIARGPRTDDYWFLAHSRDIVSLSQIVQQGLYHTFAKSANLFGTMQTLNRASDNTYLKRAALAHYSDKSKMVLVVPSGTATTNTLGITISYRRADGVPIGSTYKDFGISTVFASVSGKLYGGSYNGFVYELDTGQQDDGSNYTGEIETGWLDFGRPNEIKTIEKIIFWLKGTGDFGLTVTPQVERDGEFFALSNISLTKQSGTGIGGYQLLGWSGTLEPGRVFNFIISNGANEPPFSIHRIVVDLWAEEGLELVEA